MIENPTHVDRIPIQPATVTLTIPCSAEYVSVARLAILGIASRLAFSYDEVEDVRLAVGEACTHAVERAKMFENTQNLATAPSLRSSTPPNQIAITCHISEAHLAIEVADNVEAVEPGQASTGDDFEDVDIDHQGLGALLIEILVDEVVIDAREDGTTVKLLKYAPSPH